MLRVAALVLAVTSLQPRQQAVAQTDTSLRARVAAWRGARERPRS
jgi:hypothetical protein